MERAWQQLLTKAAEPPVITSTARIVAPFAMYAAKGETGSGIFERDGWFVGMKGTRALSIRRDTGPREAVLYNVSWTGNDGTFRAPARIRLPLNEAVTLPVSIAPVAAGASSALLNLHDTSTHAIVFRTQATVVAAERFEKPDRPLMFGGRVPLMGHSAHYVAIPEGIGALGVEVTVTRGILNATILRSHGLSSTYYDTVNPVAPRTLGPGTYAVTIARPEQGTWTLSFVNDTARRASARTSAWTSDAEYKVVLRLYGTSLDTRAAGRDRLALDVTNRASSLEAPALDVSDGFLRSHRSDFLSTGFPNEHVIDVPPNAAALKLDLKGEQAGSLLELFLYDCTTGQCFSHSFTVPATRSQTVVVQNPRSGRWLATISAAPFLPGKGGFLLNEVITIGKPRRFAVSSARRLVGETWSYDVPLGTAVETSTGPVPVWQLELVDLALTKQASDRPWNRTAALRDVPLGTVTYLRR